MTSAGRYAAEKEDMVASLTDRLAQMGVALPSAPKALAQYAPAVVWGALCFTSGQLPFQEGALMCRGPVGSEVDLEQAQAAARQCALNALAAAAHAAGGVDRIRRPIKVVGFVQAAPGFGREPAVVDGASALFSQLFGPEGAHARSAVGVQSLPLHASVELECIFEIEAGSDA